ncbi:enoyl-CoA hydratase [Planococcus faecalis]|uniref:Enoyl-CoA hydratase n=1 Tax=Planococcus faecalis TaxID=1598147 RepID=A0ABM6IV88_9BACL|nr:enoyl-CoA hydratase [Planococcus faecalis]AQU80483.1 enoyl-CoA hydratase [Planococcus faecalis]
MTQLLSVEKNAGIATVFIDNPPMNVLNQQVIRELNKVFSSLKEDEEVVAIILTGRGDKAFVAGADIKEFPERTSTKPEEGPTVHEIFNMIEDLPKPTIAVLNGYTLGGGLELALTCDIRIAEEHAQIGLPEVKLSLLPGAGGTQRLPRLVGPAKAKELLFTGDSLSATEAERLGLVNSVVPQGEGLAAGAKLAEKFARQSLQALSRLKRLVNVMDEQSWSESLALEEKLFEELFETEDAKEGITAFIEKRKPVFKHR